MINNQLVFNNNNEKIRKFNKLYTSDYILIFSELLLVAKNVSYDY